MKTDHNSLFKPEQGIPEMNGWLSDIRYSPESKTFQAVSYKAQFIEITEDGILTSLLDLPQSQSNLYLLCPCGKRTAVLSRRVQTRNDNSSSAFFTDILTMIENRKIIWIQEAPRREDNINNLIWDREKDHLALFWSLNRVQLLSPLDGSLLEETTFQMMNFPFGLALRNGLVYFVNCEKAQSMLEVHSLLGHETLSLPSQRRVKQIIEGPDGVFVQEGDEKVFHVIPVTNCP